MRFAGKGGKGEYNLNGDLLANGFYLALVCKLTKSMEKKFKKSTFNYEFYKKR